MREEKDAIGTAWAKLTESLTNAGANMDKATADLSAAERADGFRALARGLKNQLGRLEVDDGRPELAAFNLWREKFYMDNPDCMYWVAEIAHGGRHLIKGRVGHAAFTSINVYAGQGLKAESVGRLTSDDLEVDGEGRFTLTLGGAREDAAGQWIDIPENANMVWLRQFYDDPALKDGECTITRLDDIAPPPFIEAERFAKRLTNTAMTIDLSSKVIAFGGAAEVKAANQIREWSEMQGGAVYTEPGIHYQRGAWQLRPDEALVIEGQMVPARHMSALLYSRFLNSLDYNNRQISLTGPCIETDAAGAFRLVLCGQNPGVPNWLDTEGRPFGLFVIRWLQPSEMPLLPTVRVLPLADLKG